MSHKKAAASTASEMMEVDKPHNTDGKKLRVDNTTFTRQLRQVLAAGSNITFDTSNVALTSISAASGQNLPIVITNPLLLDVLVGDNAGNVINRPLTAVLTSSTLTIASVSNTITIELPPSVVKFYQSALTYLSSDPAFAADGGMYTFDDAALEFVESSQLVSRNYIFRYAPVPGTSTLQTELAVSHASSVDYTPWVLRPTASSPSAASFANVNGVVVYATTFASAEDLSMQASQYSASTALNYTNDYTLVAAGSFPLDQSASNVFFSTSGSSTVYPVLFGNNVAQLGTLVFDMGEPHYIPFSQDLGIYVFRISFTTAFISILDVFFNGIKIYSRSISSSLTAKSLGLGGLLSLGNSGNTASFAMSLVEFTAYNQALSDQQCVALTKSINFSKQIVPGVTMPYPGSTTSLLSAPINSAASAGASGKFK